MDDQQYRRPRERRDTAITREQPRTQRPTASRPRTGNAADRERARRQRMAGQEAQEQTPIRVNEPRASASRPQRAPQRTGRGSPAKAAPGKKKKRKKKPHRIYNTNFGFKFLTMLAVVAVILLSMVIFFKIKHIYVDITPPSGAGEEAGAHSYYTPEEIIEASGIHLDDNLLSLSKAGVASRIHTVLPYVNEIQIKKKLPGSVIITVSEFEVTYGIEDSAGQWWLISREGRVLEPTDDQSVKSHLVVTGMRIQTPELGDYIKPVSAEGADLAELAAKRSGAVSVLEQLEFTPFAKEIRSVDVSTSYDILLWYGTQFEIKLGNTENLTYKLQCLQAVLEQLGRDKSGTIDLTFTEDNQVHFLPFG